MKRHWWVLMHRWVGLLMAGFLIVAGLTGSLLAWYDELSKWLAPELYPVSAPHSGALPLDALTLRDSALAFAPAARIHTVALKVDPARAAIFTLEGGGGPPEVAVDPYSGAVIARLDVAALETGQRAIMPFIYRLHYALALGTAGSWAFGVVALLWTVDCLVGAALTLPRRRDAARRTWQWPRRWAKAWLIRLPITRYKLNVDLHLASGLWLWAWLLVFAWSSVAFNLGQVYGPAMRAVFPFRVETALPVLPTPQAEPGLAWRDAHRLARSLMGQALTARGHTLVSEDRLSYDPASATFSYAVRSSADRPDRRNGATSLVFDANDGRLLAFSSPLDERLGDTVERWLFDLHLARVWGWPYDVLVSMFGVAVAVLSITGVVIWWKKRVARTGRHPLLPRRSGKRAG